MSFLLYAVNGTLIGGTVTNTTVQKEYPGKMTLFVFITCLVAATGGLIFGYDIGISGGVTSMDSFLLRFFPMVYRKEKKDQTTNQYCKFDSQLLTTFTSSLYLAALIASFFCINGDPDAGQEVVNARRRGCISRRRRGQWCCSKCVHASLAVSSLELALDLLIRLASGSCISLS